MRLVSPSPPRSLLSNFGSTSSSSVLVALAVDPLAPSVAVAVTPTLRWPVTEELNCSCADASSAPEMVMAPPEAV